MSTMTMAVAEMIPSAVALVEALGPARAASDGDAAGLALAAANDRLRRVGWCNCAAVDSADEVYYRNPMSGNHGWMHVSCRRTTQTG